MRILIANKFWYLCGGVERVMFDEIAWLEEAGHTVAHFSTTHPRNITSPWSEHFVPYLDIGPDGDLTAGQKAVAAARMFYSVEARRRFAGLLDEFQPDIVHAHAIHRQISPSILGAARQRGVPVVNTLHDHHLVCPADLLTRGDGALCAPRACGTYWYGPCVRYRCMRGRTGVSALSAAETSWQRVWRTYQRGVSRFISPSRFVADEMSEGGIATPCDVIPNGVEGGSPAEGDRSGFLLAGRLHPGKGFALALDAARRAGVPVTVAGDGPQGDELRAAHPEADFLGQIDRDRLTGLAASSVAVVVPSIWNENVPMAIVEAMAVGTPVIASRVGGIPELVADGVDGLLVEPGDVDGLTDAMRRLAGDPAAARAMGEAARRKVVETASPQGHVALLIKTYRAAGART